ncbi:MAG: hypothetical protein ABFR82_09015 [Nitrospirota bacterium]
MTAKDQNGNVIHTERRKYQNWNLWFDGRKEVALQLWDITATANVNLGLEPDKPDLKTNVVLLDKDVTLVTIEVAFLFEDTPDHWTTIKKATQTLPVHSADKYFKKK